MSHRLRTFLFALGVVALPLTLLLALRADGPGESVGKVYSPRELVAVSRPTVVAWFVTRTVAPAIAAPLGSVTLPLIVPCSSCARQRNGAMAAIALKQKTTLKKCKRRDMALLTSWSKRLQSVPVYAISDCDGAFSRKGYLGNIGRVNIGEGSPSTVWSSISSTRFPSGSNKLHCRR